MQASPRSEAFERLARAVSRIGVATRGRVRTGSTHEDADGDAGTFATDDAVGFDPIPLIAALSRHGARVVVMGQVAGILHGSTELTGDLDLLWDGRERHAAPIAAAFDSLGTELTDLEGEAVACTTEAFLLPKVYFRTPTASGDCCAASLVWGELDINAIISRAETMTIADGIDVTVVSAIDLITMRRAVGRPKDLRRASELEQILATG